MAAEIGRQVDVVLARGTGAVLEAAHATALHLSRMVGAVSEAASRAVSKVGSEAGDLVWSYRHVAGNRPPARGNDDVPADLPDPGHPNNLIDIRTGEVVHRRQ
ncbi:MULTISPECIES: hypothetical protein [unclassified Mycobacterium]|uniref:hypothetical protein n=1 Tax=unclassified Mycobacterium TaxID=2642494 RepID=UPI0008022674|nr:MULTISPECIES: hypothetical protein [unclassified Mycobacterium]OBH07525.1 hypothetical protein A5696_22930 [Mycobacterium sp. E2699]OBI53209.1 hypothetical protein A5705_04625 [Mycobacterium sp. E787]